MCKECNEHFGRLEEAVKPLLVPMARGEALDLDAHDQALLALWGAKTGIALLATTARELLEVIPVDHRRSVRFAGVPHNEMWVGYYPWDDVTILHGGQVTLANDNMEPPDQYEGYTSLFSFGNVGFKLVGLKGPLRNGDTLGATNLAPISQVWPAYRSDFHWPEGTALNEARHMNILVGLAPIQRAPDQQRA